MTIHIEVPAIKGFQAKKEFFSIIMDYPTLVKFLKFVNADLPPEQRAQRQVDEGRAKTISNYMLENPEKYVLPALTASISGQFEFIPTDVHPSVGTLRFDLNCTFLINDGQHRRLGIELAIAEDEGLLTEGVAVTLFIDQGLKRSQQMFSDLNSAKPVQKSLNILYDNRSKQAAITKSVIKKVEIFTRYTEMEKASLSAKSNKLFVLSWLHEAINASFHTTGNYTVDLATCQKFWQCVADSITEWRDVLSKRYYPEDVRKQFISCTAIALNSLGKVGKTICEECGNNSSQIAAKLKNLRYIDWDRNNQVWQSICVINGKVSSKSENRAKMVEYITNFLAENYAGDILNENLLIESYNDGEYDYESDAQDDSYDEFSGESPSPVYGLE